MSPKQFELKPSRKALRALDDRWALPVYPVFRTKSQIGQTKNRSREKSHKKGHQDKYIDYKHRLSVNNYIFNLQSTYKKQTFKQLRQSQCSQKFGQVLANSQCSQKLRIKAKYQKLKDLSKFKGKCLVTNNLYLICNRTAQEHKAKSNK